MSTETTAMKRWTDTCTRCNRNRCEVADREWCSEWVRHDFLPAQSPQAVPVSTCPGRESTYVPWTMGETFQCTTCGARKIQHHNTQPLRNPRGVKDYDSIYPFPEHEAKSVSR